jgi:excisionase family DNA binding protein
MGRLDIDQAARLAGTGARQIRLLIEDGELPATRPGGRWLIDERDLPRILPAPTAEPPPVAAPEPRERPAVEGVRPIGADPVAAEEDIDTDESLSEVLARLEQAAVQIADLRAERDGLRLQLREQVSSLQRSLEDSMEELDVARARVSELEAGRFEGSLKGGHVNARAALTPLFTPTTPLPGGD